MGRRELVRQLLLEHARSDQRVTGAAVTGSGARGTEDRWSDIDLFFGVSGAPVSEVVGDWAAFLYDELGALHHFDLVSGPAIYRAFLLDELLEVDLGFTTTEEFGALGGGAFRVVFGNERAARPAAAIDRNHLIGLSWHHVMHARHAIERDEPWQAEYWISSTRDHILTFACERLGHATAYARGAAGLPRPITASLEHALVRGLDRDELFRALRAVTTALLAELAENDLAVLSRLRRPLLALAELPDP